METAFARIDGATENSFRRFLLPPRTAPRRGLHSQFNAAGDFRAGQRDDNLTVRPTLDRILALVPARDRAPAAGNRTFVVEIERAMVGEGLAEEADITEINGEAHGNESALMAV
jgi:hypothetical protein